MTGPDEIVSVRPVENRTSERYSFPISERVKYSKELIRIINHSFSYFNDAQISLKPFHFMESDEITRQNI